MLYIPVREVDFFMKLILEAICPESVLDVLLNVAFFRKGAQSKLTDG